MQCEDLEDLEHALECELDLVWPVGLSPADAEGLLNLEPDRATGIMILADYSYGSLLPFPFTKADLYASVREQDRLVTDSEFDQALEHISVVETTDGDAYIGVASVAGEELSVRTGFPGRPVVLQLAQVESIVPAAEHPDVEVYGRLGQRLYGR